MKNKYPIGILCQYLNCSRSGYYDWVKRGLPAHNKLDGNKKDAILAVYNQKPTRGRRQVQMQLKRQFDLHMSLGSVHRYMSILCLQSKRKRQYKLPQKGTNPNMIYNNELNQNFKSMNEQNVWLTDITYLPAKDGVQYLSCIKSLKDKTIIAYSISCKNDLCLVMETLHNAIKASTTITTNTIIHSDQGSQYCSPIYQKFLKEHGFIGSMSRKGVPYDNAPMESFFSLLKNEELKLHKGLTMEQLKKVVADYIYFYNYQRPQYGLKKLTPIEFRNQLC